MTIELTRLIAEGPGKVNAEIIFGAQRCLVRGPSDSGKSYIRDCLWYLLGGDKLPKPLPEAEGYLSLTLQFKSNGIEYEVVRAFAGGGVAVYTVAISENGERTRNSIDRDIGELLVDLSGAGGKQILRSKSEKGNVTGGDLRHWFMLSQPMVISEEPTSGSGFSKPQRVSAFHLFLTGSDDAAVELVKSTAEVEQIKGQLGSAEDGLRRAMTGIPPDVKRVEVIDAITRVDDSLTEMNRQYDARATRLRELRSEISDAARELQTTETQRDHCAAMVERFQLLDLKYSSDLERLGATNEGVAFFQSLPTTPCPLCGTSVEQQIDPKQLKPNAPEKYRVAIAAEAEKIRALRKGLLVSLEHEISRLASMERSAMSVKLVLEQLEQRETAQLAGIRVEFSADPKTLAVRRSELSAQLNLFDEIEHLNAEIDRLKKAKIIRKTPLNRECGASANDVADYAKQILNDWGFLDIVTVTLDGGECDLVINGRPRLSYGAGKRGLFLTALLVALLHHSLKMGYPHLGVIVIDSPLKAYADPTSIEQREVTVSTVTDNFYSWLSQWNGPGQIVILENEKILDATAKVLAPIQFSGVNGSGRTGFYPFQDQSSIKTSADDNLPSNDSN
ncbi:MAG: hypothetical protein HY253_10510 [Burkholderiales bacterium]|nr:hypothetical protein [Burkholderiales bacterium]